MNYIQQAYKGENKVWMFVFTTILVAGIFIGNLVFMLLYGDEIDLVAQQKELLELIPSKNFWLAANLLPFAVLLGLLFLLVRYIHNRSILSLTTARNKIDWSRVFFSFSLIVVLTLVIFAIGYVFLDFTSVYEFVPKPV